MSITRIAILGSTSHIAKGLIYRFLRSAKYELHLFSRSIDVLSSFLTQELEDVDAMPVAHRDYSDFANQGYDVIINCCGAGTQNKLRGDFTRYFSISEESDNLILNNLARKCPDALYISFSSGSIYGRDHSEPFTEQTCHCVPVNHVIKKDFYAITRLYSEAKHRAFEEMKIVDLRIFSYFSRYIDMSDGYFITDILDCIMKDKTLITSSGNMVRDYLHPDDLFSMIKVCMNAGRINTAFDAVSAMPVDKKSILDYFSREYGLRYTISEAFSDISATGQKNLYYSSYNAAADIGYVPQFTSMDTLKLESSHILHVSART
jgi:nucleoside-diphosphate-sugar epimerase